MALWAVIMAGGSGTRFWPASRAARPKQLLPLAEPNRSLLASTVARLHPLVAPERIVVVTAAKLAQATRDEVPSIPKENVLAEPAPRNTAPCIGWASRVIGARDDEATVVVLPSDHFIADPAGFRAAAERAFSAAKEGAVATIGIRPTRPDTGFGYIEVGAALEGDVFEVIRFVEKPDVESARAFVESLRFLWNAGMFFFNAKDMDEALRRHMPKLATDLDLMCTGDARDVEAVFPKLESKSIDYGVMEPLSKEKGKLAVVAGDFGWSDVGSWESAWELASKDANGNALPEGAIAVDARGNLAHASSKKVVALVGISDLVVVETDDALLVMPRARAQDVREVVERLKSSGKTDKI